MGIAKDFDFQMLIVYVMFKLTFRSQAQQEQLTLIKLHSYEVGPTQFSGKLENLPIHQIFN